MSKKKTFLDYYKEEMEHLAKRNLMQDKRYWEMVRRWVDEQTEDVQPERTEGETGA